MGKWGLHRGEIVFECAGDNYCERIWRDGSGAGMGGVFGHPVRAGLRLIVAEMVIECTGDDYPTFVNGFGGPARGLVCVVFSIIRSGRLAAIVAEMVIECAGDNYPSRVTSSLAPALRRKAE